MNTHSNRVPESYGPLLHLAYTAENGAASAEPSVGLVHNPLTGLIADRRALEATQATYHEARAAHAAVRNELRVPTDGARLFCANAVDLLKHHFGRRWNARWSAVGFPSGSIALPTDSLSLLMDLAAYLRTHPEHENAPLAITADLAETHAHALIAARGAVDRAHVVETQAKQARDLAFRQLRHRLSALRGELAILLPASDARWYCFGFRRPADSRMPEPVEQVSVRQPPAGEAIVAWKPSRRAANYRVTLRIEGEAAPSLEVLVSDTAAVVPLPPSDRRWFIGVSARNRSGETAPSEVVLEPSQPGQAPPPAVPA